VIAFYRMMHRIHYVNKRWCIPLLVFISSALVLAGCSIKASPAPTSQAELQVSARRIQDDIVYISANFPNRLAGTALERDTAHYVRSRFEQLGLETVEHEFPIDRYEYSDPSFIWWESTPDSTQVSAQSSTQQSSQTPTQAQTSSDASQGGSTLNRVAVRPFLYSPPTGTDGAEGELVYCHLGRVSDLAGIDVRGKIALIRRGDIVFTEKALNVQRAGAIAALMYNYADDSMIGTLVQPLSIPVLGVGGWEGNMLVDLLTQGKHLYGKIGLESRIVPGTSCNIRGEIPSSSGSTDYMVVGAHVDSVDTPGANDNASGLAALMELARIIAANPVKQEIQLIAFGAEEIGLRGSIEAEKRINTLEGSCQGMVNLDTVGSGQLLKVYTIPGGDTSLLKRLADLAKQAGTPCEADFSPYSDHTAFARAGIPAVFMMREPADTIHTLHDTPEAIESDGIRQIVELVYQLLDS
jgi:aminopeptidase YwaD